MEARTALRAGGVIAAIALLLPGLFAGLTVPLPFIFGDADGMPATSRWERLLVAAWVLGFGAGPISVLSTPVAIPLAAWAVRQEGVRSVRGRCLLTLAILSVLGLCTWLLVSLPRPERG